MAEAWIFQGLYSIKGRAIMSTDVRKQAEQDAPLTDYRFFEGPWENARVPTIVQNSPTGGDPNILCEISRIYNPDAIYELCSRANNSIEIAKDLAQALRDMKPHLGCNRVQNGKCMLSRCMKEGGYKLGDEVRNWDQSTCPDWRAVQAIAAFDAQAKDQQP